MWEIVWLDDCLDLKLCPWWSKVGGRHVVTRWGENLGIFMVSINDNILFQLEELLQSARQDLHLQGPSINYVMQEGKGGLRLE